MEFGLNFFPCLDPAQRSPEQYFSDVLHLTGLCDELGYTHVRQVEHYFHPCGCCWKTRRQARKENFTASATSPRCPGRRRNRARRCGSPPSAPRNRLRRRGSAATI